LSKACPTGFNFSIEIVDEFVGFARDAEATALGLLNDASESLVIEAILVLCPLPLLDKLMRTATNGFKGAVEEIGTGLER
jgi:hypothetical protein